MALDQAAFCKQALVLESKEVAENRFHPAFMLELDALLLDVYASLRPTRSEYEERRQLVQTYNTTAKSIFGNIGGFPVVEAFGSFIMDIFTAKSDLDLSINFNNSNATCLPRNKIISVLRRFAKVLYKRESKGHLSGVLPILTARVPVLKAVDITTGIECDISVENKEGISRSLFFSIISSIDERFRIVSYLMKAWAKVNNINSSRDGTMNSLSIISLVSFHLQTRDPPILPPFSALLTGGRGTANIHNLVLKLKGFGGRNKESIAELFVGLLVKLSSVEKLWELGLCASTFEGSWISKTWCSKVGNMSVEDFLDRDQNFARCVGKSEMPKIYSCIRSSLKYISDSMLGQIEISQLGSLLFGSVSLGTPCKDSKGITKTSMEHKLSCTEPAQPPPNVTQSDLASKKRKRHKHQFLCNETVHPHVETVVPTSHADSNTGPSLKQKTPPESVQPLVVIDNSRQKSTCSASLQLKGKIGTCKRACYDKVAGASHLNYHENRINLNSSVLYPIRSPLPPLPIINGIVHPQTSFTPSVYLPHQNHHGTNMVIAPQYQTRAPNVVHLPYGSQGGHHILNVVNPIIFPDRPQIVVTGHSISSVGQPQLPIPWRPPRPHRR